MNANDIELSGAEFGWALSHATPHQLTAIADAEHKAGRNSRVEAVKAALKARGYSLEPAAAHSEKTFCPDTETFLEDRNAEIERLYGNENR